MRAANAQVDWRASAAHDTPAVRHERRRPAHRESAAPDRQRDREPRAVRASLAEYHSPGFAGPLLDTHGTPLPSEPTPSQATEHGTVFRRGWHGQPGRSHVMHMHHT